MDEWQPSSSLTSKSKRKKKTDVKRVQRREEEAVIASDPEFNATPTELLVQWLGCLPRDVCHVVWGYFFTAPFHQMAIDLRLVAREGVPTRCFEAGGNWGTNARCIDASLTFTLQSTRETLPKTVALPALPLASAASTDDEKGEREMCRDLESAVGTCEYRVTQWEVGHKGVLLKTKPSQFGAVRKGTYSLLGEVCTVTWTEETTTVQDPDRYGRYFESSNATVPLADSSHLLVQPFEGSWAGAKAGEAWVCDWVGVAAPPHFPPMSKKEQEQYALAETMTHRFVARRQKIRPPRKDS